MKKMKNAFASIRYYKFNSLLLLLFFSGALLLLTLVRSLINIQQVKMKNIEARWSVLKKLLNAHDRPIRRLALANQSIQTKYEAASLLVSVFLVLLLILLIGMILYKRKNDIKAMISFGVKRSQIVLQFVIESLIPMFISFALVSGLLFLFQSSFKDIVTNTNERIFADALPTEIKEPKIGEGQLEDSEGFLLPFTIHSFSYINAEEELPLATLLSSCLYSCIFLMGLTVIVTSIVTVIATTYLGKRMYF